MVDHGAVRKLSTNTHSFIVSKVKDISFSIYALNRALPHGKPRTDPERISCYQHEELDWRNNCLPDVLVFPRYSYCQGKIDSMDVKLLLDHFDKDQGPGRTWPPSKRCLVCPECRDPTIGCTGVVVIEFILKATPIKNYPYKYPAQKREFTPVLLVSRFIPRLYHDSCYLKFMDNCIKWGAPDDWFSCEREILGPGQELKNHPNLTMQWLDVYDALSEYDEHLRNYFHKEVPMFPQDESKVPKNMSPNDLDYEDPPKAEEKEKEVVSKSMVTALHGKANEALEKKLYGTAAELYTRTLTVSDSDQHILLSNRAKAYLAMKKYDEAIDDANRVIRLEPNWIEGYQRKAEALIEMDRKFEAIPIITVACDIDPKDTVSAALLTRAVELKQDSMHMYRVLNAHRFRRYERFLDLVCCAVRDMLENAPAVENDDGLMSVNERAAAINNRLCPETKLMFAMQFARRLSQYLPRLGHPSLEKHARYFAAIYKKHEPMIAKIGTLLSQYSESGVPVDSIRPMTDAPGSIKKSEKAALKKLGGNPKKKKRTKEKMKAMKLSAPATVPCTDPEDVAAALRYTLANDKDFLKLRRGQFDDSGDFDYDDEPATVKSEEAEVSESKSKPLTTKSESNASKAKSESKASKAKSESKASKAKASKGKGSGHTVVKLDTSKSENPKFMVVGKGEGGIDKIMDSMSNADAVASFSDPDNPMRTYGLSDKYMELLKDHYTEISHRTEGFPPTALEVKWASLCNRDPHELSLEELHTVLTVNGICIMGAVSREKLLKYSEKTLDMQQFIRKKKQDEVKEKEEEKEAKAKELDDAWDSDDPEFQTMKAVLMEEKRKMEEEKRLNWESKSEADKIRTLERKKRMEKYTDPDISWTDLDMDNMVSTTLERDLFKSLYEEDQKKRDEEAKKRLLKEEEDKKRQRAEKKQAELIKKLEMKTKNKDDDKSDQLPGQDSEVQSKAKALPKETKNEATVDKQKASAEQKPVAAAMDPSIVTASSMSDETGEKEDKSKITKLCNHCLSSSTKMLKCGRCLAVHYCNRECQKADYAKHKKVCQKK